jgi:uncharacterized protein YvpB
MNKWQEWHTWNTYIKNGFSERVMYITNTRKYEKYWGNNSLKQKTAAQANGMTEQGWVLFYII